MGVHRAEQRTVPHVVTKWWYGTTAGMRPRVPNRRKLIMTINNSITKGAARKAADAAVRTAVLEGRQQFLGFLRRRLGHEDAEEAWQVFILRALERSQDLHDVASVRGWLARILASTLVDHQRRATRQRRRETVMCPDDLEPLSIEDDVELDEVICNCLYKLLPTLKPEYAAVIQQIDLLGEPRDQVAKDLGISLNNVAVRLHRGRQALKRRLEEMCLTCPEHGFFDCSCDEAQRAQERRGRLVTALGPQSE